ncbi:MAG: WXG100 family type VII secretion target [Lachnospiraceae bacterium]|jgi:WXG100 family type VII secretion target|nr:WXG100 family type VII secretion target [Lachnospiraceae bacterium]
MADRIETNTGTMKSDVESIQTEIRGLTDDGKKLQNAVSELNGMWEGEAKEAFMNAFQTDLNSLEDMISILSDITSATSEARSDYENCESKVSGIVASIKI